MTILKRSLKMNDTLLLMLGILLSLGCAVTAHFFLRAGWREDYRRALLLKGTASLCFVLLGAVNRRLCPDDLFGLIIQMGLCLGFLGDELLAMRYIKPERHDAFFSQGAAVFALGHLLYITALFLQDRGLLPLSLPVLVLGIGASWLYQRAKKTDAAKLQLPATLYIALVVFMASVACAAAVRGFSVGLLLFAAGGICFAVSDNLLCTYCFGTARSRAVDRAVHITYYAAQLLIAWSLRFL